MLAKRLSVAVVFCAVVSAACGLGGSGAEQAREYQRIFNSVEDEVFKRIAAASPTGIADSEEEDLRQDERRALASVDASRWATERLAGITPPLISRSGHAALVRYYELGVRFSETEVDLIRAELAKKDPRPYQRRLRMLGSELLRRGQDVARLLPFVTGLGLDGR